MHRCRQNDTGAGRRRWLLVAPGLLAIALFAATLGHSLVWDDTLILRHLQEQYEGGGLAAVLLTPFTLKNDIPGAETTGYYRPVVLLSFWLDSALGGGRPFMFHLTNVLLHAAASVLVCLIGVRLLRSDTAALLAAVLFAAHPAHVESVAFVSGRTDLLAAVSALGATAVWARWRDAAVPVPPLWRAAGGALVFLAALSKETAFVLPPVLAAWHAVETFDGGRAAGNGWRRLRPWLLPWAFALCAAGAWRWSIVGSGLAGAAPGGSVASLAGVWAALLRLLMFPVFLTAYYTPDQVALSAGSVIAALAVAGLFLAGVARRFDRIGVKTAVWTAAFLVPVSGIVPLRGAPLAERFLYLPSVGFCLLVAALLVQAGKSPRFKLAALAAGATVTIWFGATTVPRSRVWRDETTLFSNLVKTSPRSWLAHYSAGVALGAAGKYAEAEAAYLRAISLKRDLAEAYHNLGVIYAATARQEMAVSALRTAIWYRPAFAEALGHLGISLATLGKGAEALEAFERAVRAAPGDAVARYNLGYTYLRQGDRVAAQREYETLRRIDQRWAAQLLGELRRAFPDAVGQRR